MIERCERHFCIILAGHTVAVDALYPKVYFLCRDYLSNLPPEICISTTEEDIAYELAEARRINSVQSAGYLEALSIYRKISNAMLAYDTFLMHGAVVAVGNKSYMFTASSGTGKTTHIKKWLEKLPDAYIVNGDKPLIKINDKQVIACGTPWCGKERMGTNAMVPLLSIVLMERGDNNSMEELSFGQAFTFLLQQTYRPDDASQMKKTLSLLSQLNGKVRFFRFCFNNMKDDAFSVAYQTLTDCQGD